MNPSINTNIARRIIKIFDGIETGLTMSDILTLAEETFVSLQRTEFSLTWKEKEDLAVHRITELIQQSIS